MACKACASVRQRDFWGELTAAFPGVEKINLPPVYVCTKILVCLDCGYAEIVIPTTELEKIRKSVEEVHSKGA